MSQATRIATEFLKQDTANSRLFHSAILSSVPGARVAQVVSADGTHIDRFEVTAEGVLVDNPGDGGLRAVVRLPDAEELVLRTSLDAQRLEVEDKWKRRTWLLSIATAVITATTTIAIAYINASGEPPDGAPVRTSPSADAIAECGDSLDRLDFLAGRQNQTVDDLKTAISQHKTLCAEVWSRLLEE